MESGARGSVPLHARLIISQAGCDSRPRNSGYKRKNPPQWRVFSSNPMRLMSRWCANYTVSGHNSIKHNDQKGYNNPVYYVYIPQSPKRRNWLYKGSTSNLKKIIAEHNSGKNFSTAPYKPLKLIYYETYLLKTDALAREKYLKTSMGIRVLKKTTGKLS